MLVFVLLQFLLLLHVESHLHSEETYTELSGRRSRSLPVLKPANRERNSRRRSHHDTSSSSHTETVEENALQGHSFFIIAGTQKSGTTALAAYLSMHPNISMSERKEIHFFDKTSTYERGIAHYLTHFPVSSTTLAVGEATPFYLASRHACARIQRHLPRARLIVLLREPVDRAYSEYQMKARRVEACDEFVHVIQRHQRVVRACLLRHRENYKSLDKCLPAEITEHGRYSKLIKALKKSMAKWNDWQRVVDSCFPPVSLSLLHAQQNELVKHLEDIVYVNSSTALRVNELERNKQNDRAFSASSCWQNSKEGLETLQPLPVALEGEAEEFLRCKSRLYPKDNDTDADWREQLRRMDDVVNQCITVKSGISRQYIYRSMYAVQLYHCFKSIDTSRFLILPSDRLRTEPREVMKEILSFIGFPLDVSWLPDDQESQEHALVQVVQSKFSSFEKTTSWKLRSQYESLSKESRNQLKLFFNDQNELLFKLIGQNFTDIW